MTKFYKNQENTKYIKTNGNRCEIISISKGITNLCQVHFKYIPDFVLVEIPEEDYGKIRDNISAFSIDF